MTWVKLSDTFAEDPRLDEAGPLALALHVAALCYCARQLTDGRIARGTARRLLVIDDPDTVTAALVNVGMWKPTEAGFELVDYLEDQPSADKVRHNKRVRAERQQRWRDAHRGASHDASRDGAVDASRGGAVDPAPSRPAPPRRKAGAGGSGTAAAGATPDPAPGEQIKPHDFRAPKWMDDDDVQRDTPCRTCARPDLDLVHWAHAYVDDETGAGRCSDCLERTDSKVHIAWDDYLSAVDDHQTWPPPG